MRPRHVTHQTQDSYGAAGKYRVASVFRSMPVGGLSQFRLFAQLATPPSIKPPSPRLTNGALTRGSSGVSSCRLPSNHRLVTLSFRAPERDLTTRTSLLKYTCTINRTM